MPWEYSQYFGRCYTKSKFYCEVVLYVGTRFDLDSWVGERMYPVNIRPAYDRFSKKHLTNPNNELLIGNHTYLPNICIVWCTPNRYTVQWSLLNFKPTYRDLSQLRSLWSKISPKVGVQIFSPAFWHLNIQSKSIVYLDLPFLGAKWFRYRVSQFTIP